MWHTHSFIFKFHILCNAKIVNNKIESLIYLVLAHSNTTVVCWSFSQCVRCFFFTMYKYLLYLCNVLKNQIICSLYLKINVNVFSSEWQCDEIFDPWFLTPGFWPLVFDPWFFSLFQPNCMGPLFICCSIFKYGLNFTEIFASAKSWFCRDKLRGVSDTAKSNSFMSLTLRSQICCIYIFKDFFSLI